MSWLSLFLAPFLWVAQITAQAPAHAEHLRAAQKAEAAQDFAAAEKEYEKALALAEDPAVLERLGLVRHLQNKFSEAIPAFERSIHLRPASWSSRLFLGIAYYRTNRFGKALEQLEHARRLRPGEPEVRFWLGVTRIALKQHLPGLEVLEDLAASGSVGPEVMRILAQTYSDYATQLLNQIVERHSESAAAAHVHAMALESRGLFDNALDEYRKAFRIDPQRNELRPAIGRILWNQGRRLEAVEEFRKELTQRPEDPESNFYLGLHHAALGDAARARRYLEAAVLWTHDSPEPVLALARLLLDAGEPHAAAQSARRAAELAPDSAEIHEVLLKALRQSNQPDAITAEQTRWEKQRARRDE